MNAAKIATTAAFAALNSSRILDFQLDRAAVCAACSTQIATRASFDAASAFRSARAVSLEAAAAQCLAEHQQKAAERMAADRDIACMYAAELARAASRVAVHTSADASAFLAMHVSKLCIISAAISAASARDWICGTNEAWALLRAAQSTAGVAEALRTAKLASSLACICACLAAKEAFERGKLAWKQAEEAERMREIEQNYEHFQLQQKQVLAVTLEEMLQRDNQRQRRLGKIQHAQRRIGMSDSHITRSIRRGDKLQRNKEMKYIEDLIVGQDTIAQRHLKRATSRIASVLPPIIDRNGGRRKSELERAEAAEVQRNTALARMKAKVEEEERRQREIDHANSEYKNISLGRLREHQYRDRITTAIK
jgi:hypothetical protein